MLKAYKYRIYPINEQISLLEKHFGCTRWVWNYMLAKRNENYKETGKGLSRFTLQKELPVLKKSEKTKWLKEVDSQALQVVLLNQKKAFDNYFRQLKDGTIEAKKAAYIKKRKMKGLPIDPKRLAEMGKPKFKSKKDSKQAFNIPQRFEVDFDANKLFIPKLKTGIKAVYHRQFEGVVKNITILKTNTNKYYVSYLVQTKEQEIIPNKPIIEKAIGIDLGLKDFLITNNGEKVSNPKYLKKSLKRLKLIQRRLSRKVKSSNNRKKYKIILARQHERIASQRLDFLHKLSYRLTHENQVDTICIEDLNVKGMLQNHKLAQSISDVSWSKFVELLQYKSRWYGKNLVKIGMFEASSKTCSVCGSVNHKLKLQDREWTCENCRTTHDRDINGAQNVLGFAFESINKKQKQLRQDMSEVTLVERGVHSTGNSRVSPSLKQEAHDL